METREAAELTGPPGIMLRIGNVQKSDRLEHCKKTDRTPLIQRYDSWKVSPVNGKISSRYTLTIKSASRLTLQ